MTLLKTLVWLMRLELLEDKSENVDTLTEDIANIEADVDSSILETFAKSIQSSRGVKTKTLQTDTHKFVNGGQENLDAEEMTATISMLLLRTMMINKRKHTQYFHVLDASLGMMIRVVSSTTL